MRNIYMAYDDEMCALGEGLSEIEHKAFIEDDWHIARTSIKQYAILMLYRSNKELRVNWYFLVYKNEMYSFVNLQEWSMQTNRVGRNALELNENYDGNAPYNKWHWPFSWRRTEWATETESIYFEGSIEIVY